MRKLAFWLSLALVFVVPWENIISVAALGTLGKAIGLLVGVFWVATIVLTGQLRKPQLFHWAVLLFILWNGLTIFWSVGLGYTEMSFKTYLQLGVLVYIFWDLYRTPDALNAGLQAYVLGAYVSLGSLLYKYLISGGAVYTERLSADNFNANDLGLILALGLPMAWHLAVFVSHNKMGFWLKVINLAYIPLALLGIILTASRSSLGATFPTFIYMLSSLTRLKLPVRMVIFATLGSSLFLLQSLAPQAAAERLAGTGAEITSGDLNGRLAIWQDGVDLFLAHPIFGVGSGAFERAAETGRPAHNFVLTLLAEIGLVGFGLFALLFVIALYKSYQQPQPMSRLWLAILLAWVIGVLTHNWEHRKQTWLLLSLSVASASAYAQRDRTPPKSTDLNYGVQPHDRAFNNAQATTYLPKGTRLSPPAGPHQLPSGKGADHSGH